MSRSTKLVLGLLVLALMASCTGSTKGPPRVDHGVIDLRTWDFAREGRVPLDGEWDFFWQQLRTPPITSQHSPESMPEHTHGRLPGYWTIDTNYPAQGWATYHLFLRLPIGTASRHQVLGLKITEVLSAFRMYIEGIEVYHNGTVGTTPETSKPEYRPGVVFFSPADDDVELTIQVSNFHYRKGGIWASPVLGTPEQVGTDWFFSSQLNLFLVGGLLIMAIYHFVLWALRRRDLSPLWFGMFCLIVFTRVILTGDQLLSQWWPGFDWELGRRLEFLPLCLGVIVFFLFIRSLFPDCVNKSLFAILMGLEALATLAVIVLPVVVSNELVVPLQVLLILAMLWLFWIVSRALRARKVGAWAIVGGSFVLLVTIVNDILYADQIVYTGFLMPLGFFVFILMQALILSIKFTDSFRRTEQLSQELEVANRSFRRFVPHEFLQNLSRDNITQIALGDQVQRDMTVMFADIRSFTSLSESMSPRQTFNFLNSYLKRMGPIIRQHGGFIDKFIGDGMLALFPAHVEEAIDAAVTMYSQLQEYNRHRHSTGYSEVNIGIALNHGSLILGTIGEADRMETTVISDAVNVASRLEGLCKFYGPGILIPESMLAQVTTPGRYRTRRLDIIRIRGRQEPVALVQVLDGQPEAITEHLPRFLPLWEQALVAYRVADLPLALDLLTDALKVWPGDLATMMLIHRIAPWIEHGLPSDWSPVIDWSAITASG